jgi:hypothetical protein
MIFTDFGVVSPPVAAPAPKKKGFWNGAGGKTVISILVVGAVGAGVAAQHD